MKWNLFMIKELKVMLRDMKIQRWLLVLAFAVLAVGCSGDRDRVAPRDEYGALDLSSVTVSTQKSATRVEGDVDTSDFVVRIYRAGEELVKEWNPHSLRPAEIWLKKGSYTLEVSSPTLQDAAFDAPWYVGKAEFTIVPDETITPAPVVCKLGNIKVTAHYSEVLKALIDKNEDDTKDAAVTVSVGDNTLSFPYGEERAGYFSADGPVTMTVNFAGTLRGLPMNITETFEVVPGEWEQLECRVNEDEWTFDIFVSRDGGGSEIGQIGRGEDWF
jgi:hypothetical protein